MFSKKEFLTEEKDCANMLGMNLEEYHEYLKNTKILVKNNNKHSKHDNKILKKLGLSSKDLKRGKAL